MNEEQRHKGGSEMNVKQIMAAWLKEHDYDGLWNAAGECGCKASDLAPCDGQYGCGIMDCRPGYLNDCPASCGEHDWHITSEKHPLKDTDEDGEK